MTDEGKFTFVQQMVFPKNDTDKIKGVVFNMADRVKWDPRYFDGRVLETKEDENMTTYYFKTKKPPIPMISQREVVC